MSAVPRGLRVLVAAAMVGTLPLAVAGSAGAAPTFTTEEVFPSQEQVDAAKSAVDVAAGSVADIEAAYSAASARLAQLQIEADMAANAAESARVLLAERTSSADAAAVSARRAASAREKAVLEVRRTAAQLYQEQGDLAGVGAYLDSQGPQQLADRTAALAVVGDLRQRTLDSAHSMANLQAEAEKGADHAKQQQDAAAEVANNASESATVRARNATEEAARIRSEQELRIAALASAKATSLEVERARVDGLARKAAQEEAERRAAAERAEAERIAAEKRAEEAAREAEAAKGQQGGNGSGGGSGTGGGGTSGGGSGSGGNTTPPPTTSGGYSTTAYRQAYLRPNANAAYSAIRSLFGITNIGGYRGGPGAQDHGTGRAIDVMTSSFTEGDAVAAWVQAHSSEFDVKYIIWKQRIWFPGNAPNQWRWMEDRGSITQNHYDHVHVSVN